jgi:hypothetical protein
MSTSKTASGIDDDTAATGKIRFANWVPPEARKQFNGLYRIVLLREGRYMLQRLATRPTMEDSWAELKNFKNVTPDNLVLWTVVGWLSAMRSKPKRHAPPGPATHTNPLPHELAPGARAVAEYMRAVHSTIRAESGITNTTLLELDRVSAFIQRQADFIDKTVRIAMLPHKAGARNAHHVTFVNFMCDCLSRRQKRRPYLLVAILVNVAFDVMETKEWDYDRVKHCYRSRSRKK